MIIYQTHLQNDWWLKTWLSKFSQLSFFLWLLKIRFWDQILWSWVWYFCCLFINLQVHATKFSFVTINKGRKNLWKLIHIYTSLLTFFLLIKHVINVLANDSRLVGKTITYLTIYVILIIYQDIRLHVLSRNIIC